MSRLHRIILLLLLAVAIPFQGFAAAAMTHCGVAADAAMSAMDDDMEMDADMHAAMHDGAKADAHKGSCSACAACCVVAAPGFAHAPWVGPSPIGIVDLPAPTPRVDFLTDGPERPPRHRLA